jgi:hypothetical protein
MLRLHSASAIGLAGLTLMAVTACGSSKHAASSTGSASPSTSTPSPSSSGTGGSSADATTTTAVTTTFVTLFNGMAPLDQRAALLQNATAFGSSLGSLQSSSILQTMTATVQKVVLVNPTQARVTYTLLFSGTPTLPNQTGTAVQSGGTWKVSATTFCSLLTVAKVAPAECTQASVTALPS